MQAVFNFNFFLFLKCPHKIYQIPPVICIWQFLFKTGHAADRASGVHPGDALTVRFPALDREMKAKVIQVLPPADPKAGTSAILVEVADPERLLRPGMSAVARLPQKAVIERTSP